VSETGRHPAFAGKEQNHMKMTFVGGGSSRLIPSVREILKIGDPVCGSHICLYDIDQESAEAVARILRQFPEARGLDVTVSCPTDLDEALEGADFVELLAGPWNWRAFYRSFEVCTRYGYLAGGNLSVNAAFSVLKGGPLALDIAHRMERVAPDGLFMIFTNPIAVLAKTVNAGTSIRGIGICEGQIGHFLDVPRVMGWDQPRFDIEAIAAGTNHFSWIVGLTLNGDDLLPAMAQRFAQGIDFDRLALDPHWGHIEDSFRFMVDAYYVTGHMIYSIEGDGVPHLIGYDDAVRGERNLRYHERVDELLENRRQGRQQIIERSRQELGDKFWNRDPSPFTPRHPRTVTDACVLRGMLTDRPETVSVSYLNNGIIEGFDNDDIVEYTVEVSGGQFRPMGAYPCRLPPATSGVTHGIVEHQMLLAQAVIQEDPRIFEQAIYAYPMCRTKRTVDALLAEMKELNADELPPWMK